MDKNEMKKVVKATIEFQLAMGIEGFDEEFTEIPVMVPTMVANYFQTMWEEHTDIQVSRLIGECMIPLMDASRKLAIDMPSHDLAEVLVQTLEDADNKYGTEKVDKYLHGMRGFFEVAIREMRKGRDEESAQKSAEEMSREILKTFGIQSQE